MRSLFQEFVQDLCDSLGEDRDVLIKLELSDMKAESTDKTNAIMAELIMDVSLSSIKWKSLDSINKYGQDA
eukprot:2428122-Ditylum_brightwellii.AAC.1